jgi:hypothetical protein
VVSRAGIVVVLGLALVPVGARAQAGDTNARDWLAIGDALATGTEPASLDLALEAYAHVLERPSDPDYALALHHTGWLLFLLDRPSEAIARFVALVDHIDATSRHPELRAEAIDLLGAMFADPDWDRDGAPDAAGTLARLTDAGLIAQDRAWLPELYFETAHALYLSLRDPEAIALLDHALSRWPVPADGTPMDAACRRHRARQETEDLARTAPETDALCARLSSP